MPRSSYPASGAVNAPAGAALATPVWCCTQIAVSGSPLALAAATKNAAAASSSAAIVAASVCAGLTCSISSAASGGGARGSDSGTSGAGGAGAPGAAGGGTATAQRSIGTSASLNEAPLPPPPPAAAAAPMSPPPLPAGAGRNVRRRPSRTTSRRQNPARQTLPSLDVMRLSQAGSLDSVRTKSWKAAA